MYWAKTTWPGEVAALYTTGSSSSDFSTSNGFMSAVNPARTLPTNIVTIVRARRRVDIFIVPNDTGWYLYQPLPRLLIINSLLRANAINIQN